MGEEKELTLLQKLTGNFLSDNYKSLLFKEISSHIKEINNRNPYIVAHTPLEGQEEENGCNNTKRDCRKVFKG